MATRFRRYLARRNLLRSQHRAKKKEIHDNTKTAVEEMWDHYRFTKLSLQELYEKELSQLRAEYQAQRTGDKIRLRGYSKT